MFYFTSGFSLQGTSASNLVDLGRVLLNNTRYSVCDGVPGSAQLVAPLFRTCLLLQLFTSLFLLYCSFQVFPKLFYLQLKRVQESVRATPIWCNWKGEPVSSAGPPPSTRMVPSGKVHASPDRLSFRDPSIFISGSIHHSLRGQRSYTISPTVQHFFANWSLVQM